MSPTDEIRWINKLAAKYGKKKLSKYHQWVLGGCKGPHPMAKERRKANKPLMKKLGPCPDTKVTDKHYREVAKLEKKVAKLKDENADLRFRMASALAFLRGDEQP